MDGLTVSQAAERSIYSRTQIRRACAQGLIKAELIGKTYLLDPSSFSQWVNNPEYHKTGKKPEKRGDVSNKG